MFQQEKRLKLKRLILMLCLNIKMSSVLCKFCDLILLCFKFISWFLTVFECDLAFNITDKCNFLMLMLMQ